MGKSGAVDPVRVAPWQNGWLRGMGAEVSSTECKERTKYRVARMAATTAEHPFAVEMESFFPFLDEE